MEPLPSNRLVVPAMASAGAAVLHATAAGIHADHVGLSRIFMALAVAQAAVAIWGLVRPDRPAALVLIIVNAGAAVGWAITRVSGVPGIPGLDVAERPQLADTAAAVLALVAVVGAAMAWSERTPRLPGRAIVSSACLVGLLVVPGLASATSHDHDGHDDRDEHTDAGDPAHEHDTANGPAAATASEAGFDDDHDHDHDDDDRDHDDDDGHEGHDASDAAASPAVDASLEANEHDESDVAHDHDEPAPWPRPWDPADEAFRFDGVPGASTIQQLRAEQLVIDTLRELPAFDDVATVPALGYRSIGDASTGFEHYINAGFINDDKFLDPTAPESLVYEVDGDDRTLVSAMFIASETPIDDPELLDFGGPLMQWHVHDNLCWGLDDDGRPVVKGVLENFGGSCPAGTINAGGENPMVHVWIAPHECGPFAALEGHGAGQADSADGTRADQCSHGDHGAGHDGHEASAAATPYDPTLPIDLGGIDGVTPQQQAFAENLVAATVRDLPQWADLDAVEAAGFHSIGDGNTGHEHYIQWDWIDDDVWLDPDYPESLVFEPQPDGSKQLVSAMFMLPGGTSLDDVPDYGGELMQWHVHGDLCFTDDPVAPVVARVKRVGEACKPPLVDFPMSPMIHVWITPHECGPFAALDGIAGGQVPDGEAILCDTAHGSH